MFTGKETPFRCKESPFPRKEGSWMRKAVTSRQEGPRSQEKGPRGRDRGSHARENGARSRDPRVRSSAVARSDRFVLRGARLCDAPSRVPSRQPLSRVSPSFPRTPLVPADRRRPRRLTRGRPARAPGDDSGDAEPGFRSTRLQPSSAMAYGVIIRLA